MKKRGRKKKYNVVLADEEVLQLEELIADPTTGPTIRNRCRILLELDEAHGEECWSLEDCAKKLQVGTSTVCLTAKKYAEEGFGRVTTVLRSEAQNRGRLKLDEKLTKKLYRIADSKPPKGHERWTMRLLAAEISKYSEEPISKDTVCRAMNARKQKVQ